MSDQSLKLGLPYILPSQAQKHVTHNEAIDRLDVLVQMQVVTRSLTTPPSNPTSGACYLIAPSATGAWAGKDNQLAVWRGTHWEFFEPLAGWRAYVLDESMSVIFDGALWNTASQPLQNVSGIGVNTTSDSNNRLASSAPSTLLTHDGAGHQLKVNKSATSETASLVFQNDFTGHAEIGLVANNDLQLKVSPNGANFLSALSINATSAITNAACLSSGTITIGEDTVGTIPTPSKSGLVMVLNVANSSGDFDFAKINHSGVFIYDSGQTPNSVPIFVGSNLEDHDTTEMTGTSSASGESGFSVRPGSITIENRMSGNRVYSYTFLGGA